MANDVMQRPLFAGPLPPGRDMPMPPAIGSSVGTGITSGLVDPAQEQLQAEAGFARLAGTMGNIMDSVDNASSPEEAMNAVRGDQAPLSERRRELAQFVGEKDAEDTPVTVLAFLQPTFTIMEMIQKQAPQGGISDVMPQTGGGESTENFNLASSVQAPGAEEAMMRMAAGEQPVRRQLGTPPTGENINKIPTRIPKITVADAAKVPSGLFSSSLPYLAGGAAPQLRSIDPTSVQNYASDYMGMMEPFLANLKGGAGPGMEERLSKLSPYLPQTKTSQEILQEYQDLLGSDSSDAAETQAYLALMQAGANIAGSDKSLLGAAVEAAGKAAPELAKIAAQKSAEDRALKLAARQEAVQGAAALKSAQLSVANQAISDAVKAEGTVEAAIVSAAQKAIDQGIINNQSEVKAVNDKTVMEWNANNSFAQLPTETFAKLIGNKTDLQNVYRTQDGLKIYQDGKFKQLPEGYVKYDKNAWAAAHPSSVFDLDGAQKIDILIPDPTGKSVSGYSSYAGFYKNGNFWYSPTGKAEEAIPAPRGFIMGGEDMLETTRDEVGRVFVTITKGSRAGETFLSKVRGTDFPKVAYELETPVRDKNGALLSGNPLVETIPNPGIPFAQMSGDQVKRYTRKVLDMTQAITEANEVLPLIGEAVGPLATVKSWTSNTIGALGPEAWKGMTEFAATERGRARMEQFGRQLARALALSEKYALGEQKAIIEQMAQDPNGFWKNPNMTEVRFAEMMRTLQNELSFARGVLADKQDIPQVRTLPTGSANDPIMFSGPGEWDALTIQIAQNPQAYNEGKYDKITVRFTRREAEARGIAVPAGKDYVDLEVGSLKKKK